LVREIQRKPVSGLLLHVDFYQVSGKEKMTGEVPVHVVGTAPALETRANTMDIGLPMLTVECLPADLPARIDVNVGSLKSPGDAIRVSDIQVPEGVTIMNDHELVVVMIELERKKGAEAEEAGEQPVAEAAEKAEAKPESKAESRPAAKAESRPAPKADTKPAA